MMASRWWLKREERAVRQSLRESRRRLNSANRKWIDIKGVTSALLRREQENNFSEAMKRIMGGYDG
jgi:phage shock protein A